MSKQVQKKGHPSYVNDGLICEWAYEQDGCHSIPAIEQCMITVVKHSVKYYSHFNYGPELMKARRKCIKELGWSSESFDLPLPPKCVGEYSLLSHAIKAVNSTLDRSRVTVERRYPSTIILTQYGYGTRTNYCILFFNGPAYEFYSLLFKVDKDNTIFELPAPHLNTLNQLLKWAKSFEFKRRRLFKAEGFTWEPYSKTEETNS